MKKYKRNVKCPNKPTNHANALLPAAAMEIARPVRNSTVKTDL